eukprot:m.17367 g.17367  ORF g.17367 m.17367 type:complete len:371 (+) comp27463_c0_seq2:381-1493(+)
MHSSPSFHSGLAIIVIVVLVLVSSSTVYASWWEMARDEGQKIASKENCKTLRTMYNFTDAQMDYCKRHWELMETVALAARSGVQLCENTMSDCRWNCPNRLGIAGGPVFGITRSHDGIKEVGFIRALMTAVLSYRIIKKCSDPNNFMKTCGCDRSLAQKDYESSGPGDPLRNQSFSWDSCSDNILFGNQFAADFADSEIDGGSSLQNLTDLHNSRVGRKVIEQDYSLSCTCHGLSGSCSLEFCWKTVKTLPEIGKELKKRYAAAIRVKKGSVGGKLVPRKQTSLTEDDMVYIDKPINFCRPVDGIPGTGTKDRICNVTIPKGKGSCEDLCCGRGYRRVTVKIIESRCQFKWCCKVVCKDRWVDVQATKCY